MDTVTRAHDCFWIETAVIDLYLPLIGPDAYAVYNVMTRYAQCSEGQDFRTDVINKLTGLPKPRVKKCLETLREVGLVAWYPIQTPEGKPDGYHFDLLEVDESFSAAEHLNNRLPLANEPPFSTARGNEGGAQ